MSKGEYDSSAANAVHAGGQSPVERAGPQLPPPDAPTGTVPGRPTRQVRQPGVADADQAIPHRLGARGRERRVPAVRAASAETAPPRPSVTVRQPWDTGRGESSERRETDTRTPLVKSILESGDKRPPEEKVEVIARASTLLEKLHANADLIASVRRAEDATLHLGNQVLARKPTKDERRLLEGRGTNYENVPVDPDNDEVKATVYVKGTGNEANFKDPDAPFSGFPGDNGKFFHDGPGVPRPRINGAEYIPDAVLDLVNSVDEFAQKADKHGWTSIDQATEKGVMIPLFVTHFKEASEHFADRITQKREAARDEKTREALTWGDRYFGIGTVTQIVPSPERLTKGILHSDEHMETYLRVTEPENYAAVGKAVRQLLDEGAILYPNSAHAQNVHINGVAVADPSDHMFLAHCKGVVMDLGRGVEHDFPPAMQQVALLYNGFNQGENMTPHYFPNPDAELPMDRVIAMQMAFWRPMLEGYAKPEAIRLMAGLMPFLRTEFALSSALLLVSKNTDNPKWAEAAVKQDLLLNEFPQYSVREEYEEMFERGAQPVEVFAMVDVMVKDKLPINAMMRLLTSGKLKSAQEEDRVLAGKNDRVADIVELATTLATVPDERVRDRFLGEVGQYFGDREILRLFRQPDAIAAFEGFQASVLTYYLHQERYVEAKLVLDILNMSVQKGFRDAVRTDGLVETSEFHYPRMLADADPNNPQELADVYNNCVFDKLLFDFAASANPVGENQSTTVFDSTGTQPAPEKVIRTILGNYMLDEQRNDIAAWLHQYTEVSTALSHRRISELDRQALTHALDDMAADVKDTFPELAYGHALIMANRYSIFNPELSESYRQRAGEYEQTAMAGRIEQFEVQALLEEPTDEDKRLQYGELAEDYDAIQAPLLADIYRKMATEEMKRFAWPPESKAEPQPQR